MCVGLKLKTTRHGQRANGRADGERFHVKLACRDTNDLKALNRSEQAAGCRLHAAGSKGSWEMGDGGSTYQHRVLSTHLEPSRVRSRVWVKPLQVSLARCVRNNLHSHQEFINCLWQLHSTRTPTPTSSPCFSCSCTFRFLPILPHSLAVRRHNLIKPAWSARSEKHQCSRLESGSFSELPAPPSPVPVPAPTAHSRQHPIDCINVFLQNYCLPRRACLS